MTTTSVTNATWLGVSEVVEMLGLSRSKVQAMAKVGTIQTYRLGKTYRFEKDQVPSTPGPSYHRGFILSGKFPILTRSSGDSSRGPGGPMECTCGKVFEFQFLVTAKTKYLPQVDF